ncbi:MAG: PEGA domain-containing protein [Spirochaetaceae bacterium]|nr:MAG: PEGA domain-containing protein [Spirochaetaceae bacterium]
MKAITMVLLVLVLCPVLLHGRARPEEPAPPIDERKTWRVGVLPFDAAGLTPEQRSLARSVPMLLLETFAGLREHRLSEDERDAQRRLILDAAVVSAGSALDREIRARDRLLFTDVTREVREERLEAAEERVAEARARFERLEAIQPAQIEVAARKPLEIRPSGAELLPVGVSPREIARRERLDYVFSGSIRPLDDEYLILEIYGYSAAQQRTLLRDTEILRPEEVLELIDGVVGRVAEAVLGRPWANLTVRSSQPDAAVLVDGMLYGFGAVTIQHLEPGRREVTVTYEDREHVETMVLLPFERAELTVEFAAVEIGTIVIESEPRGADVYVDSVWMGRTPIAVNRPQQPSTVLLQRDGHHSSRFVVGPESPEVITRQLASDIVGWSEQTRMQRDRFYRSLGFFVVSLPAPIILNGVYDNLFTLLAAEPVPDDADRLRRTGNTVYWAYWGSVGVSSGLFVNMAVQLVRYIRAAESYHFH